MVPHAILFGFINPVLGRYEKAVEEAHKAIELAPDTYTGYLPLFPTLDLNC
jgi:hypothetical protein